MASSIRMNGEEWDVRLTRERPHHGVTSVIFRCASNSSYGWRVVEVPEGEFASQEGLETLGADDLRRLFERSQPFDYSHDPKAQQDTIGDSSGR